MSVLRNRPKGARFASFGLGLCVFALIPTEIGYQDIASLLARQPGVAERWQKRVFASAVSSIQVATFSFGRPIGTSSRAGATFQLASLDNQGIDITGSLTRNPIVHGAAALSGGGFPQGQPRAEGRSPRQCHAGECGAIGRFALERRPLDVKCIGDGRKDRGCMPAARRRRSIRNSPKR